MTELPLKITKPKWKVRKPAWRVGLFRSKVRKPYWRLMFGRRVLKRVTSESGGRTKREASFITLEEEAASYNQRGWKPSPARQSQPAQKFSDGDFLQEDAVS